MVFHFDNATRHTARQATDFMNRNRLMRELHRPFSPDLPLQTLFLWEAENGSEGGKIQH
jgi:hypothetical protein